MNVASQTQSHHLLYQELQVHVSAALQRGLWAAPPQGRVTLKPFCWSCSALHEGRKPDSACSEKQMGLGPCPSSKVYFNIFNWWLFIDFKDVWIMNSAPFTGETNASPSSWGVRQNNFHGNSCGGLQYSPELPPLLSWEVEACPLSGSRGNCGLFPSADSIVQGLIGHRHEPCFWFCQKRFHPYLQERFRAVYRI